MTVTKREAVIVDVDGTLVNVSSIRHHVRKAQNPDGTWKKKNFDAFHRDSVNCPLIQETYDQVATWYQNGVDVIIVTARSERYYPQTAWWLAENRVPHDAIYMRADGDYRQDYVVKREILERIRQRWDVIHAIDDNPSVIALWEEEGIGTTVVPGWEDLV